MEPPQGLGELAPFARYNFKSRFFTPTWVVAYLLNKKQDLLTDYKPVGANKIVQAARAHRL